MLTSAFFSLIRAGLYFCCTLGEVAVCCEDKPSWQTNPWHVFPGPHNATGVLRMSTTSLCLSSSFFLNSRGKATWRQSYQLGFLQYEHFSKFPQSTSEEFCFHLKTFSSKTSKWCLVHRSSVLRVPHAIKSLKHIHSKGPSTIHLSCWQSHLTNTAVSSIPTTKGNHRLWLHLPRLSRALQSQHSGSALMQSQPHSKISIKSQLGPAQTHIHIWILTSVLQVFSVLKFSLIYSQPKTGQSIFPLQFINSCVYIKNIQR